MLGEVQYGGRVTDDYDRRLMIVFTHVWFNEMLTEPGYKFYAGYPLPPSTCKTADDFIDFISELPSQDLPEVFGLHSNADISFQINTAKGILDQILYVQPKETGSGGLKVGETREAVVSRICEDMLRKLPREYTAIEVKEAIIKLGGLQPMNIFLRQEIDRIQKILSLVRNTLKNLTMAIEGTLVSLSQAPPRNTTIKHSKLNSSWTSQP